MKPEGTSGVFPSERAEGTWIIGYGNRQRRDDGIGPYVIDRLSGRYGGSSGIRLWSAHILAPDLIEDLQRAQRVIFVDATIAQLKQGWIWDKIAPDFEVLPYVTHQVKPSLLLGLLERVYGQSPGAYLFTVQGEDFDFGEGLTGVAQKRADQVVSEISRFV